MSWAKWPVDSDCYEVTAGDESAPSTSYIPSDPELPQYTYVNIRTVCYGLAFRGLLMYAVNGKGDKVGEWNVPADTTVKWKQPWKDIPGHQCEQALMHASGMIKPYFTRYRFQAPLAGQGKLTFKILIKQGDANEGAFFRPQRVLELTEAPASLPDPIFLQTAADQTCSELCQTRSLECDRESIALLNSSVALDKKLVRTVPCNLPFLESTVASSSYADPLTGMCYYSRSASCDVRNQFCACSELSSASGLAPKLLTLFATSALLALVDKRFAVVAIALVYLIGSSEAHNWLGTVSRSLGSSTINPCKQSRTGSPHIQMGTNQEFSITFFNAHGGDTYFSLVPLEDVPKLGKLTNKDREAYLKEAPAQAHTDVTSGKYQQFNLNRFATNHVFFTNGTFVGRVADTDPLFYKEGDFGAKAKASFNGGVNFQTMYNPSFLVNDKWVSYDNAKYPYIKSMWRYRNTLIGTKDMAKFKLPSNLPVGRYVIQYSWGGYYDCVDVDVVNFNVDFIYGAKPVTPQWNRVDHCTVKNPRASFPRYGPEEVVYDVESCKRKMAPLTFLLPTAEEVSVDVIVASNLTAYQAFNFQRYADAKGNWTVKNFAFPGFPGAEAVFPIEQKGGWNSTFTPGYMQAEYKHKIFCWGAVPPEFTTTTDIYFTTDDPLDPVFYSTCWVLNNENVFADVPAATEIPTVWKHNEKCVSCNDQALMKNSRAVPIWRVTDQCRNCDLEPGTPSRNFTGVAAAIPTVLRVQSQSRCSGFVSTPTSFGTWIPGYPQCGDDAPKCWKNMKSANLHFPDVLTQTGGSLSVEECGLLVEADPECTTIFQWLHWDNRMNQSLAEPGNCVCMTNKACCGTRCKQTAATDMHIYETRSIPDPGCVNGVKTSDGTFCCPSSCPTCKLTTAPNPSPAPTPTQTPRPVLTDEQFAAGYRSVEACVNDKTPAYRTCNIAAPPCYI